MLLTHPADRILFGTDTPWSSQSETLGLLRSLDLGAERESLILSRNAEALLGQARHA